MKTERRNRRTGRTGHGSWVTHRSWVMGGDLETGHQERRLKRKTRRRSVGRISKKEWRNERRKDRRRREKRKR